MAEAKKRAGRSVVIVGLAANGSVARHLREDLGYVRTDPNYVRFYVSRTSYGSGVNLVNLAVGKPVRDLSEILLEIGSATKPVLAVVVLDAHHFRSADLIRTCSTLNKRGIDTVLSGYPRQDFFEVAAWADIPVIDTNAPCLHELDSGSCGRPGKGWVWYNKTGYFPAVEFLKEILQVLLWFLKKFHVSPTFLLKAYVYLGRIDQHYPNIPDSVASLVPWFVARGLFGDGLRQESRCRIHTGQDRYDHNKAGYFTFVVGSCEAGKSTKLALEIENVEMRYGPENVMACTALPRGSRSRVPGKYQPDNIVSVQRVLDLSRDRIFCFVDEAELYGTDLVAAVRDQVVQGKFVHAASYQVRGDLKPFANTAGLMELADKVIYLPAVCEVCGLPAHKTQVLVRQKGIGQDKWHALSATEFEAGDWIPEEIFRIYEVSFRPRCLACHELPESGAPEESMRLLNEAFVEGDLSNAAVQRQGAVELAEKKKRLEAGYRFLSVLLLVAQVIERPSLFITPSAGILILVIFYSFWRKFGPPIGARFRIISATIETSLMVAIALVVAVSIRIWENTPQPIRTELWTETAGYLQYYATLAQIEVWREIDLSKLYLGVEYYWDFLTLPIPTIVSIATAIFLGIELTRFIKRLRKRWRKPK